MKRRIRIQRAKKHQRHLKNFKISIWNIGLNISLLIREAPPDKKKWEVSDKMIALTLKILFSAQLLNNSKNQLQSNKWFLALKLSSYQKFLILLYMEEPLWYRPPYILRMLFHVLILNFLLCIFTCWILILRLILPSSYFKYLHFILFYFKILHCFFRVEL